MGDLKAVLPQEDGILLRPQLRKKLKLSKQKKVSLSITSLPLQSKRGRKKQDSAFRNRVGRKAQALRKVHMYMHVYVYRGTHSENVHSVLQICGHTNQRCTCSYIC